MTRLAAAKRQLATFHGPWRLVVASWFMWLFVGAYAITPASLLPTVMGDLGIGEAAAAWVITAPQVGATVAGIPIGMYLDRVNNRHAIALSVGLLFASSVGAWFSGAVGAYWWLLAARFCSGVLLVSLWTANTNVVSNAFGPSVRATAVSAFVTGYPAGYAFGQLAGPYVVDWLHWSATFAVFGGGAVGCFIAFWWASTGLGVRNADGQTPQLADFADVLRNRGVWGVCVMSFLLYTLYMIVNSWMPSYMSREFTLSLTQSGLMVAVFPVIGIVARPLGGVLSDRVFAGRRRPVVFLSFATTGVVLGSMVFGKTVAVFGVGLLAAGFFLQMPIGLLYTYGPEFVGDDVAGTAIAAISVIGWLGSFVGPVLVGTLIQVTEGYVVVFTSSVVLAAVGVATVLVVSEASA